mgnify:FL=1
MDQKPRIYILPKVQFHAMLEGNGIDDSNVDEYVSHAFISINDFSGADSHTPLFRDSHHNVITLFFDDVKDETETSSTNKGKVKAFDENMAERIVKFLDNNRTVKNIIIHCAAGISRSGAVGTFALDYLGGDKELFKRDNPMISPNGEVLRILHNYHRGIIGC